MIEQGNRRPLKIAVFSPYATSAPHFETELEIIQRHLDDGDCVEMAACLGDLSCCTFNMVKSTSTCENCVGRRKAGLALLSKSVRITRLGQPTSRPNPKKTFSSIQELIDYRIDNFEIGYAVLSSLVSYLRDSEPDVVEHAKIIERLIESAVSVYDQTIDFCRRTRPDRVYNFNGRFAAMRAVLRGCETCDVDCVIHERGCDPQHFELYVNSLPHDIDRIQDEISRLWDEAGDVQRRVEIGKSWFQDRVQRVERNWKSFVKNQTQERLPDSFDPARRNLVIFTTSEDEFVAIGDSWKNRLYKTQAQAVDQIANDLLKNASCRDFHIYLRIHPNLGDVNNSSTRAMDCLQAENLTVVGPKDSVDSYALMRACEKTITFGSTMGIEAAYWGRPSILLGPSFYRGFECVYEPNDHGETIELIKRNLRPLPNDSAIRYGFWFQTHGIRFKYFEASDFFSGRFKGKNVVPAEKHGLGRRLEMRVRKIRNYLVGRK